MSEQTSDKQLGFWACWALVVGTMIGSGIFMLPTVLAPYGLLGLGGLGIAAIGAIMLALSFARLAARTSKSGGPYVYTREAFGDFVGFVMGWAYWVSYWTAIPVVAVAFVGYLGVFAPAIGANAVAQAAIALALIWTLTLISIRGLREASFVQIVMTFLKIAPLLAIAFAGFALGAPANLPDANPRGVPILSALAATALLTLWPFTGFETGTVPAGNVRDCRRTVPRALVVGMLTVAAIYLAATIAAMLLTPAATLTASTAPFADAARALGPWGPSLVAAGAMIATAGTLNGIIFTCGQMPMAMALDRLAPAPLATTNKGGAPYWSLLASALLGSLLLLANYSRGLVGAYTFLLMMSTATTLLPYFVTALAELKHSWRKARAWAAVAGLGCAYTVFALIGSGLEVLAWGLVLTLAGAPLYFLMRSRPAAPAST